MAAEHASLDELFNRSANTFVYWDIETDSKRNLKTCGAYVYAADSTTDMLCLCYAIGNGLVEVWTPDAPVPPPFADPTKYIFVADNWVFEREVHTRILIPRYGFAPISLEQQDCAQRKALASAFPADLGRRFVALGLAYRKDDAARRAMLRLSRKHNYKDPKKYERDLALTIERCKHDVEMTRACYNHPRIRPLPLKEWHQLLNDAGIND